MANVIPEVNQRELDKFYKEFASVAHKFKIPYDDSTMVLRASHMEHGRYIRGGCPITETCNFHHKTFYTSGYWIEASGPIDLSHAVAGMIVDASDYFALHSREIRRKLLSIIKENQK